MWYVCVPFAFLQFSSFLYFSLLIFLYLLNAGWMLVLFHCVFLKHLLCIFSATVFGECVCVLVFRSPFLFHTILLVSRLFQHICFLHFFSASLHTIYMVVLSLTYHLFLIRSSEQIPILQHSLPFVQTIAPPPPLLVFCPLFYVCNSQILRFFLPIYLKKISFAW